MRQAQLDLPGLMPSDNALLILTQSHIDHVGGIADLAQSPILLSKAEYNLRAPIYFRKTKAMAWPDRTYIPGDTDCNLGSGLRLLLVPGHVAGQLALWLDPFVTGAVLLVSHSNSCTAEIAERFGTADDPPAAIVSADRLMALAAETGQWCSMDIAPRGGPT